MIPVVGILEYGCGNIKSVTNAIKAIGAQYKLIKSSRDFDGITQLILPGVGAYDIAMRSLIESKLSDDILNFASVSENKILGICLGMQLLCNKSEEGKLPGLGLINADVISLKVSNDSRVPHMGWSTVNSNSNDALVNGLTGEVDYYFIHSYCVMAKDNKNVIGTTEYGCEFASIVNKNNIWGVQFHPEKSQSAGLKIIKNFIQQC